MRTYCQSFPVSTYRKQEHADTFLSSACPGERTPRNCSGACPFPSYFSLQRHRRYGDRIRVSAGSGTLSCRGKRPPAEEINLLTGSTPFCCAAAERKRTTPAAPLCTFFCHVQIPDRDSPVVPSRPAGRHHGSMLINKKQEVCYDAILEAMEKRRSVRKYKPDMVPQDAISNVISAGLYAGKRHEQTGHHHHRRHQ